MTPSVTQSVLVYDRIAQNRRKTILLVLFAVASIIPFVLAMSFGIAESFVWRMGRQSRTDQYQMRELQNRIAAMPGEYRQTLENQVAKLRADQQQQEQANVDLRGHVMLVVGTGLVAILGLLFWGLASAPTTNLLAMCGARPAGVPETEAKKLLENLSIGAGLPVPRLYVIESSTPNAFAAGTDPSRSVIAVTRGLLSLLDRRELEGVLAHELSHIGNRDTRLNTIVAAIALFLRLPYLLRRRSRMENKHTSSRYQDRQRSGFRMGYSIAMIPVYVYIFFIAPVIATVIRSAISRSREYQADADAALLTRNPEGLMRALAKIGGAGTDIVGSNPAISHLFFADPAGPEVAMGIFSGNLMATHPPIEQRITRLLEFNGGAPLSVIEEAVKAGKAYSAAHPPVEEVAMPAVVAQDELAVLTMGNPMGRVCRAMSATPLYDRAFIHSRVVAQIKPGDLLVAFDDPGKFRQVLTQGQTFGYIPYAVKLEKVDMLPSELHDPVARTAAMARIEETRAAQPEGKSSLLPDAPERAAASTGGLSPAQIAITALFGLAVFGGMFLLLINSGK